MGDARVRTRWGDAHGPRPRGTLGLALLLHVGLLAALLHWQGRFDLPRQATVVETTIWVPAHARVPPAPREPAAAPQEAHPAPSHAPRARETAATPPLPQSPLPTTVSPNAITLSPSLPVPTPSAPLRLTLTPGELHALEADAAARRTLAQLVPAAPRLSALAQLGGEGEGMVEMPLPGGVTEVHLHGECYRLVPSARSQSDPFNHGGERLTGPCFPSF